MDQQPQNLQAPNPSPSSKEWGARDTIALVFLIVFPLIGLILMWAITNWSKKVKLIVTAVVVVIPLLVIAFLSLVVTTSLSGARQNAQDARIHATIMQTRSLAELVHNTATPMAYNDLCNNSNNGLNIGHATYGAALEALNAEVIEQTGNSAGLKCFASGENYCVSAPLASKGYSCISSSGSFNSPTATACATATDCR